MKLRITDDAKEDLKAIRAYTRREHGNAQAKLYMEHLSRSLKTLLKHSDIGFSVDDLKAGYRCFRVQYHSIYYKCEKDVISIVAVLHESQLPRKHLRNRPTK